MKYPAEMKLSPHFKVKEFTRSETAAKRGIDNEDITPVQLANMQALCENVLEPLRQQFGEPVYISSGYRCPALNKAVKGATASQHMKGEAADIYIKAPPLTLWDLYVWTIDNLHFDQLIWETRDGGRRKWIHVSYKRTGVNRQQVFTCRK